jgi:hypothetical protein
MSRGAMTVLRQRWTHHLVVYKAHRCVRLEPRRVLKGQPIKDDTLRASTHSQ